MALEIIPSIDLRAGKVVRLKQGDYAQQIDYPVDPIETAKRYADAGARWLHVVDLDGAAEGTPVQIDLISKIIRQTTLQVEVGGGIRSTSDIEKLLSAGAARAVIGTRAIEDWDWFLSLLSDPRMANKLILALDAKNGMVATRGWTETSGKKAVDIAASVSGLPVAAILYTDVAKDGMLSGPNFEQTELLAQATDVPVIASGGVGNIEHIRKLKTLSVWGAIVGRSLYEGKLDLREAINLANAS